MTTTSSPPSLFVTLTAQRYTVHPLERWKVQTGTPLIRIHRAIQVFANGSVLLDIDPIVIPAVRDVKDPSTNRNVFVAADGSIEFNLLPQSGVVNTTPLGKFLNQPVTVVRFSESDRLRTGYWGYFY